MEVGQKRHKKGERWQQLEGWGHMLSLECSFWNGLQDICPWALLLHVGMRDDQWGLSTEAWGLRTCGLKVLLNLVCYQSLTFGNLLAHLVLAPSAKSTFSTFWQWSIWCCLAFLLTCAKETKTHVHGMSNPIFEKFQLFWQSSPVVKAKRYRVW